MVNYGFNGTNTAKVLNPQVRGLLLNMFVDSNLNTLVYRLRNDKYISSMPDDEIANVIALNELFSSQGKHLEVIYTFDTRNQVSLDENFYGFLQLLANGVHISAAEMGNEEWAEVASHNGDWDVFQSKFSLILDELVDVGYEGKIIFPITQNNKGFTKWDNKGIDFINTSPQFEPALHLYYNQDDIPIIGTLDRENLPKDTYTPDVYLADKDDFYKTFVNEYYLSNLLAKNISFVNERMPGKKIWFTEYGPGVNTGGLQNTLGFHITDFQVLLDSWNNQDDIAVMCKHNGPTTPLTGMISSTSRFDVWDGEFIPRLSYHTMNLFLKGIDKEENIPFVNASRELSEEMNIEEAYYILGNNWYSSTGRCEWWDNNSIGDVEIKGITNISSSYNFQLPPLSFGFYKLKTIEEQPGCTNPGALNFNPNATIDDGSCIYKPKPTSKPKWWNRLKELLGLTL